MPTPLPRVTAPTSDNSDLSTWSARPACPAGNPGRSDGRLGNDEATEREIVIGELKQIAALRLAKAVAP